MQGLAELSRVAVFSVTIWVVLKVRAFFCIVRAKWVPNCASADRLVGFRV